MKKLISVLLALLMVLGLVGVSSFAEEARPKITITLPSFPAGTEPDSFMEKYLEDKFNVDLEVMSLPSDTEERKTRINLMMADENLMPDVLYFTSDSAREYEQWKASGILVDMYPLLKEYGNEIVSYYEKAGNGNALFSTYEDGKMYRLITDVSEPGSTGTVVRADWMEKFGIDAIETLDDYVDYLRKCVNEDPDGNGQKDTNGLSGGKEDMMALYPFFSAYGVFPDQWMLQEDGSIKYGAILPETKAALEQIASAYAEGLIDPNLISGAKAFSGELYPEGKTGAFYTWVYFLTPSFSPLNDFHTKNEGGGYIRIEPVKGPDGFASDRPSDPFGSGYVAITKKCEDPAAAMRLLNGLMEPETSIMVKNGEEGIDYVIEDGEFKALISKDERDKKGIRMTALLLERKDEYNIEIGELGNRYFAASQAAAMPLRERIAFIREKVRPTWNEHSADLTALYKTTFWSIITGEMPIEAFDDFVESWYAMGGEAVEKEANEFWAKQQVQFDEFMTNYEKDLLPLINK